MPHVRFAALNYSLQLKAESRRTHRQVFWLRSIAYRRASSKQQLTDFSTINTISVVYMKKLLLKHGFMYKWNRKEANNYLGWSPNGDQTVHCQNPSILG